MTALGPSSYRKGKILAPLSLVDNLVCETIYYVFIKILNRASGQIFFFSFLLKLCLFLTRIIARSTCLILICFSRIQDPYILFLGVFNLYEIFPLKWVIKRIILLKLKVAKIKGCQNWKLSKLPKLPNWKLLSC